MITTVHFNTPKDAAILDADKLVKHIQAFDLASQSMEIGKDGYYTDSKLYCYKTVSVEVSNDTYGIVWRDDYSHVYTVIISNKQYLKCKVLGCDPMVVAEKQNIRVCFNVEVSSHHGIHRCLKISHLDELLISFIKRYKALPEKIEIGDPIKSIPGGFRRLQSCDLVDPWSVFVDTPDGGVKLLYVDAWHHTSTSYMVAECAGRMYKIKRYNCADVLMWK